MTPALISRCRLVQIVQVERPHQHAVHIDHRGRADVLFVQRFQRLAGAPLLRRPITGAGDRRAERIRRLLPFTSQRRRSPSVNTPTTAAARRRPPLTSPVRLSSSIASITLALSLTRGRRSPVRIR